MTRDSIYDDMKALSKAKFDKDRAQFLSEAEAQDDGGWMKHSKYHWSRRVADNRLDYWPSRKKFQYKGKVKRGNVYEFIVARVKRTKDFHALVLQVKDNICNCKMNGWWEETSQLTDQALWEDMIEKSGVSTQFSKTILLAGPLAVKQARKELEA